MPVLRQKMLQGLYCGKRLQHLYREQTAVPVNTRDGSPVRFWLAGEPSFRSCAVREELAPAVRALSFFLFWYCLLQQACSIAVKNHRDVGMQLQDTGGQRFRHRTCNHLFHNFCF